MQEEENKIIAYGFSDGRLDLDIDANRDGEPVVKLGLNINEAIKEAINRGNPVEGVKLVNFEFTGSKFKLKLDSDRDGESVLELEIDLLEAFDEIKDSVI